VTLNQLKVEPSKIEAAVSANESSLKAYSSLLEPISLGEAALHADPKLKAFNYTTEQIQMLLTPMVSHSSFTHCSPLALPSPAIDSLALPFSPGQEWR